MHLYVHPLVLATVRLNRLHAWSCYWPPSAHCLDGSRQAISEDKQRESKTERTVWGIQRTGNEGDTSVETFL